MHFAKTFCAPGATISPVPAGLNLKLQYNQNGLLHKIDVGFGNELDPDFKIFELDEGTYNNLFQKIKGFVPNMISLKGGTTWVYGVMYSDRIPCNEGKLSEALYSTYIKDIIDGGHYSFYAGNVHSLAASFQGALVARNFLSTNGFTNLPQMIVPIQLTDDTLQMMMKTNSFPFKYPFVAGFFVFEDLNCRYASSNLSQINIANDPEAFVDIDGYLKGEVITESRKSCTFNYSSIIHHGVEKGCTLLVEEDSKHGISILATRIGPDADKVVDNIDHDIKCPVCGKVYRAGSNDAPVECDDPHCLSHEYFNAEKMMNVFKLPVIAHDDYVKHLADRDIVCITDLLEFPPYKDQEIKTSLAEAMYAVIPTSVVPNCEFLERFANKCNHSIETVVYYLENPLRIETDLDITDPIVRRLAEWLKDPFNVSTITGIFARVKIDERLQKFDGAPIFRGNTIAVTGKFKRGDYPEIESILRSYAAEVVPSIEKGQDLPDVLVIGSLNDGISGQMVQKAKAHNIPIVNEDDFFVRYEIDKDLAENLL